MPRTTRPHPASCALAVQLALWACGGEAPTSSRPEGASPAVAERPAALAAAAPEASRSPGATPLRPNVLLVLADDLATHLGAYGHPEIVSPNVDRLAARGFRFDRAYCQFPQCNPSRASLLSGLLPSTIRVFNNDVKPRSFLPDVVFLPGWFHEHGYYTFRAGKILHSTFDDAQPFDEVADLSALKPGAPYPRLQRHQQQRQARQAAREGKPLPGPADRLFGQSVPDPEAAWLEDSRVAEASVRFLAGAKARQPFFMAVGIGAPHPDWVARESDFALYPPAKIDVASAPAGDLDDVPVAALRFATRRPQFTVAEQRERRAAYFAAVTFMDAQLGRVLGALEAAGLADSTVVVFAGDHGQHLGEHGGLWEKFTLFEEAARAPLVMAGAGVPGGRSSACPVELLDVFPTLAHLAGLPPPAGLEGKDLVPVFAHPERCRRAGALTELWLGTMPPTFARSLATDRYRYTEWGDSRVAELYDHQADPGEHHNLARVGGGARVGGARVTETREPEARAALEEQRRLLAARVAEIETGRPR